MTVGARLLVAAAILSVAAAPEPVKPDNTSV